VVAATSSQEGLHLAQTLEPDAIVLDIMMPEMDGWELLQRLRAHPKTQEIPVVICSVINDPDLARSLGASFFLPKPVSRRAVLDVLQQLGVA
jgi:Amt family ammonium transporter